MNVVFSPALAWPHLQWCGHAAHGNASQGHLLLAVQEAAPAGQRLGFKTLCDHLIALRTVYRTVMPL